VVNSLKVLKDNRCALLLAEIGCWLHMLGKFHEGFLQGNFDLDTQVVEKMESQYKDLKELLIGDTQPTWTSDIWQTLPHLNLNPTTSIATLIKNHTKSKNYKKEKHLDDLESLLFDAHGRGSWTEKGILARFMPPQESKIYLSSAFGFEKKYIDFSKIGSQREYLYELLKNYLNELRKNKANLEDWCEFRENFINTITTLFSMTVGDTRRPTNDVSLFDQTAASVSLFKAALAHVLLQGFIDPFKSKYHWRFLRVGINSPAFWSKSPRIGDIFARKDIITSALNQIHNFIEVEYPLGYEIYRDEKGSVFVLPDIQNILEYNVEDQPLGERLKRIFQEVVKGEAEILLDVTENTRNMLLFGEIIDNDIPELNTYSEWIREQWSKAENREICVTCGIRPQGPKYVSITRNICDICEERRSNRSQEWAETLTHTIWMDEISDINGRIALVVGQFVLKEWLAGGLLNSIMAFDPETRQLTDEKRKKQYGFDYGQLTEDISRVLKSNQTLGRRFALLDNLILKGQRGDFSKFQDIYGLYIGDSDLDYSVKESWRFALLMLRQQPSFARIRRIWETTWKFWQEILPIDEDADISQSKAGKIIGTVGPRLLMKGDITPHSSTPEPYHAYEIILDETKLSVVWDKKRQGFITVENPAYILKLSGRRPPEKTNDEKDSNYQKRLNRWALSEMKKIKGNLKIEEPVGYGAKDKEWGFIDVKEVEEIPGSKYVPATPILAEPSTFMALVPADRALKVVRTIKEKYEREMGKVKNRLPLNLGVVFTHRHTPLRVIIDAGERMLQRGIGSRYTWEIKTKPAVSSNPDDPHFKNMVQMRLENHNGETVSWNVPLLMGDGTTEDNWYPYVFLKSWKNQHPKDRNRSLKTFCPWNADENQATWLVHAKDVCIGDTIYFTPSTIDFEWLDTSSRRFEIAYNEGGQRQGEKGVCRPYLLDTVEILERIWNTLKETLSNGQIYALRDLIERKRKEWNPTKEDCSKGTFWQFCRNTLAVSQWVRLGEGYLWEKEGMGKNLWLDTWADYAVKGWLSDAIEVHMHIMKEKSEVGGAIHEN